MSWLGPARPLCRPDWAGITGQKLNHKHAAQCTDPSVPPETLFMIEMVVLKGLSPTLVSSSPQRPGRAGGCHPMGVGPPRYGLTGPLLGGLSLTRNLCAARSIQQQQHLRRSGTTRSQLLQRTFTALTETCPWPTRHLPPSILLIFPSAAQKSAAEQNAFKPLRL